MAIAVPDAIAFAWTTATAVLAALSVAVAATIPATAALPTVVLGQRGLPGNSRMAAVDGRRHRDQCGGDAAEQQQLDQLRG